MFDANAYLEANPDLLWAWNQGGDAYIDPNDRRIGLAGWAEKHYNLYGRNEGRPSGVTTPQPDSQSGMLEVGKTLTADQMKSIFASNPLAGQWGLVDANGQSTVGSEEYRLNNPQPLVTMTPDGKAVTISPSGEIQDIKDFGSVGNYQQIAQNSDDSWGGMFKDAAVRGVTQVLPMALGMNAAAGALGAGYAAEIAAMDAAMGAGASGLSADAAAAAAFEAAGGVSGGAAAVNAANTAYVAAGGTGMLGGMAAAPATGSLGGIFGANAAANAAGTAAGTAAATGAAAGAGSGLLGAITGATGLTGGQLLGTGANLLGTYLQNETNKDIADQNAALAREAAEAAKFKPVGVTTRFGSSNFGYDANGRLTSAGYTLDPSLKAIQDRQMGMLPGLQDQYEQTTALGRGYLATTPQQQAQKYMQEQLALVNPAREAGLSQIQNKLAQQGRLGLSTGGTSTTMATNPEMAAYQNAIQQENLRLAAQSTQGGMDYANFGLGLMSQANKPLQTALGSAQYLEGMGQGAMDLGTSLGAQVSTSGANAGRMGLSAQQDAQVNPWAKGLIGFGADQAASNRLQQLAGLFGGTQATTQNPYVPAGTYGTGNDANQYNFGVGQPNNSIWNW
jgi:hypothetical protein